MMTFISGVCCGVRASAKTISSVRLIFCPYKSWYHTGSYPPITGAKSMKKLPTLRSESLTGIVKRPKNGRNLKSSPKSCNKLLLTKHMKFTSFVRITGKSAGNLWRWSSITCCPNCQKYVKITMRNKSSWTESLREWSSANKEDPTSKP